VNLRPDPRIQDFERHLDEALAERPMMQHGGTDALRLAANIIETANAEYGMLGHRFAEGLTILAPALISRTPGNRFQAVDVVADLEFAAHYHALRDMLYYSYNAPGTIAWAFDEDMIEIRYADPSLPRQFFISANNWYLGSMAAFADEQPHERIKELLQGTPEFEETPEGLEAHGLIQEEVDLKLGLYFNLVSDTSARAGVYTFGEFLAVYKTLLIKALYHRYHSVVNGACGTIRMPLATLGPDLARFIGTISAETASRRRMTK
jgi:hypothetical protein